jgi:arylsulfatase A-like enzyme
VRETAAIDDAVATLLEGLDAVGVGDSTWMVLWSPFAADADGTPNNGAEVSSSARFAGPLIIAGPSHRPSPSWQRFPVRDIDVAPTLLEAMGLPVPETMEGIPLLGVDAEPGAAFLRDIYTESDLWLSPDDNPLPAAVRLDYGPPSHWLEEDPEEPGRLRVRPDVEDVALAARHRLFQTDGERVIYRPTRNGVVFEYYDLRNDPSAETNLAGTKDGAQRVKDLKETFFQELRREIGWRPQNDFWIPEAFMRKKS